MKTIYKNSKNRSVLFALILIATSLQSFANNLNNPSSVLSEDNTASYCIISGVLGFGIIAFLINSILNRYNNSNEPKNNNFNRTTSHRHRYNQHRIMKKTA